MKLQHLLWLLFLLASCAREDQNQQSVQSMIEEEVAKRVENYREARLKLCREQALAEASRLADSILIAEARLELDTLTKPPKPEKPEKPELKTVIDSIPVKPLLSPHRQDTTRKDSSNQ